MTLFLALISSALAESPVTSLPEEAARLIHCGRASSLGEVPLPRRYSGMAGQLDGEAPVTLVFDRDDALLWSRSRPRPEVLLSQARDRGYRRGPDGQGLIADQDLGVPLLIDASGLVTAGSLGPGPLPSILDRLDPRAPGCWVLESTESRSWRLTWTDPAARRIEQWGWGLSVLPRYFPVWEEFNDAPPEPPHNPQTTWRPHTVGRFVAGETVESIRGNSFSPILSRRIIGSQAVGPGGVTAWSAPIASPRAERRELCRLKQLECTRTSDPRVWRLHLPISRVIFPVEDEFMAVTATGLAGSTDLSVAIDLAAGRGQPWWPVDVDIRRKGPLEWRRIEGETQVWWNDIDAEEHHEIVEGGPASVFQPIAPRLAFPLEPPPVEILPEPREEGLDSSVDIEACGVVDSGFFTREESIRLRSARQGVSRCIEALGGPEAANRRQLFELLDRLADIEAQRDEIPTALATADEALAIARELVATAGPSPFQRAQALERLRRAWMRRADVHRADGDLIAGLADLEEALKVTRTLGEVYLHDPTYLAEFLTALADRANLAGDTDRERSALAEAARLMEAVTGRDAP